MINGFVGFQWAEDGTPTSLWSIRLSSLFVGLIAFVIAIGTFIGLGSLNSSNPVGLFVVYFIFGGAFVFVYIVCQVVLVLTTLDDRWPLGMMSHSIITQGDILFGVLFFSTAQIFLYVISTNVCNLASHYIDGLFFGEIFGLLAVCLLRVGFYLRL